MVILHFRERPPFQREIGAHKKFAHVGVTNSLATSCDGQFISDFSTSLKQIGESVKEYNCKS
jgi:hypothetical protein